MSKEFTVGINTKVVGKCSPNKLSYAGAWAPTAFTMTELAAHISLGHPWMPGIVGNKKRWQCNVERAEVIGADFDGGLSIEQALEIPLVRDYAGLLIESSSSTPELNKFRVVWRLPKAADGWEDVRLLFRYLISLLGSADPACKDASRFFFGGLNREPRLLNDDALLPESFVDDALSWHEAEEAAYQKREAANQERWAEWKASYAEDDVLSIAASALDAIPQYAPGEGRYSDLVRMMAGVVNELGPTGESLLISWDGGRGKWGRPIDRFIQSVAKSRSTRKASIGTLFYLAKDSGWKRPNRNPEPSPQLLNIGTKDDLDVLTVEGETVGFFPPLPEDEKAKYLAQGISIVESTSKRWAQHSKRIRSLLVEEKPRDCVLFSANPEAQRLPEVRKLYELLKPWGYLLDVRAPIEEPEAEWEDIA